MRTTVIQVVIVAVVIAIVVFAVRYINKPKDESTEGRGRVQSQNSSDGVLLNEQSETDDSRVASNISLLPSNLVDKIRAGGMFTLVEATEISKIVPNLIYNPSTGNVRKICCRADGVNITVTLWSHMFGEGCDKAKGACGKLVGS